MKVVKGMGYRKEPRVMLKERFLGDTCPLDGEMLGCTQQLCVLKGTAKYKH